jgi:hypothetical protein
MKALIAVAFLLSLSACEQSLDRQVAECWYEAVKVYPSEAFLSDKTLNLVPMCMRARGYRFNTKGQQDCSLGQSFLNAVHESCYSRENSN